MSAHNEKGKRVYLTREQIELIKVALIRHSQWGAASWDEDILAEWREEQPIIEAIEWKLS